jgi:MFS family permease
VLGFGLMFVNTITIIDRRAPVHLSTTFQGIIASVSWGLAPLLASPISGFIFDKWGAIPLFILCGSFCLVAVLLLMPTYIYWAKPVNQLS